MKKYTDTDVLTSARKRVSYLFDNYEKIQISISGGKDSTVLWHLCLSEAIKRNRKINVFFLDQEAEYYNTIEVIKQQMNHDLINPLWYQVPIYMTNATSSSDYFLYAWGENENWIREKNPLSIKSIEEKYPQRFYDFFGYLEKKQENTANLVGLRAEESLTRFRAVTKKECINKIKWGTVVSKEKNVYKFYPIYDWTVYDVWKYINDYSVEYNKIYDMMFRNNYTIYNKMRVSNLIHEMSYKCLIDLPKFEPETYDKLCKRVSGVATASRYAMEKTFFSNKELPTHYKSWLEFRNFLTENIINKYQKVKFLNRFEKQPKSEKTYQKQVGQLLINDYENNRPITENSEKKKDFLNKFINEIL